MSKEGLSSIIRTPSPLGINSNVSNIVGKVYGVVMNEVTPSADEFEKVGGWNGLGNIFYLDYENSKNIVTINLKECKVAKPLFPNVKNYPLIGELVVILDLPGTSAQLNDLVSDKYYISAINIWNNNHHNSQPSSKDFVLGKTFKELSNLNGLQPFEGDHIIESRFGAALRFTSTCKDVNSINNWSKTGADGDPITILTNGFKFDPKSVNPYIEDVNKEDSTILLTSTQTIPLNTNKIILNVLTNPVSIEKYNSPQIIFSSNRVVIHSKKDEVFIIANSNIELCTNNIINLNAKDRVHINATKTFLGSGKSGELPDEPLLLGDKTVSLLDGLLKELINFCSIMATAVSTPQGTPILQISQASELLSLKLEDLLNLTDALKSTSNYTI